MWVIVCNIIRVLAKTFSDFKPLMSNFGSNLTHSVAVQTLNSQNKVKTSTLLLYKCLGVATCVGVLKLFKLL